MADESEDLLVQPNLEDNDDGEEEVPDFRYLLNQKIPSRGVKDFEPHGTNLQQSTLDASREAMHIALSQPRPHAPDKSKAVYDGNLNGAWVFNPSGSWSKTTGKSIPVPGRVKLIEDAQGKILEQKLMRMFLLPEEILWLIERGSIDLRYAPEDGDNEDEGLPMSIQGAYAAFIGGSHSCELTLDEYTVYQYLRRCGYYVCRAQDNVHNVPLSQAEFNNPPSLPSLTKLWQWLFSSQITANLERSKFGPLVKPGLYRNYNDIYRQTLLIPFHDPRAQANTQTLQADDAKLKVKWHVYKNYPHFKKTAPGPPDFYVAVLSARDSSLPTDFELDALLLQTPYHAPSPTDGLNKKLKDGYRNVVLAVVDQGLVSFLNLSDAGFGCQNLWDRAPRRGGPKRGGFRGRGRGRGGRP